MLDPLHRDIRRMLHDDHARSRNRNFDEFEDPSVQRAAHVARLLLSIADDLRALPDGGAPPTVELHPEAPPRLTLHLELARHERASSLSLLEWALLREIDGLARVLDAALAKLPIAQRAMLNASLPEIYARLSRTPRDA